MIVVPMLRFAARTTVFFIAAITLTSYREATASDSANDTFPAGLTAQNQSVRYIVQFAEAPLASYNAGAAMKPINGIGAIPLKKFGNGRTRLDVASPPARAYVAYLQQQQG